jgi:hypothetical protein
LRLIDVEPNAFEIMHRSICISIATTLASAFLCAAAAGTPQAPALPSAPLIVHAVGQGTFNPILNGKSLVIGSTNKITAKAATGFKFTEWEGEPGGIESTDATLTFVMVSNLVLTAHFADIAAPTITITAPKKGLSVTNSSFMVAGTAKDNVGVTAVFCRVDNGAWITAAGTTSWSATVGLEPGSNTINAYAEDAAGNCSPTNSVSCRYVVTVPVTIEVEHPGWGVVTPSDNGKLLPLGSVLMLQANASKGFKFTNWTGTVESDSAKITVEVVSNLELTANFVDAQPPLDIITFPAVNQVWSNAMITAAGKASDNVGVTAVWYQMNSGDWNLAASANLFSNWTAPDLEVIAGSNVLQSYASDAAGNHSMTNTIKFKGALPASSDWAPASLAGRVAMVDVDSNSILVSYDAHTFSQTDTNHFQDSGVGPYDYTKEGTNTALLGLFFSLPPGVSNATPQLINLTFTAAGSGVFSNQLTGKTGSFTTEASATLFPSSFGGHTVTATPYTVGQPGEHATTITFSGSNNFNLSTGSSGSGTYVFIAGGPVSEVGKFTFTDSSHVGKISYLQLTFTSATGGVFEVNSYSGGSPVSSDSGTFTFQ